MDSFTQLFLKIIKLSISQMMLLRHKRLESNYIATKVGLGRGRRKE